MAGAPCRGSPQRRRLALGKRQRLPSLPALLTAPPSTFDFGDRRAIASPTHRLRPPPTASAPRSNFSRCERAPHQLPADHPGPSAPGRVWGRPLLPQIWCGRGSGTIARVSRTPGARLRRSGFGSGTGERVAPWAQGMMHHCHSGHKGYVASGATERPEHCAGRGAGAARPRVAAPELLKTLSGWGPNSGASKAELWGPSLSAPSEAAPMSP